MREEHKLKMLKNGVLCKVFGFKRENVTGHWRKLHTEELNDLYMSQNVGWDSSVSIASCYRLDRLGIKSWWGQNFPHPSRLVLGPTQSPIQWVPGLSQWGKAAGMWH